MSKTNILAETLAEIQELREAVSKNANHALKSTLKEELEEIVKNNLEEVNDEELTDDMPGDELPGDQTANNDDGMGNMPTEPEEGEEVVDLTGESDKDVITHFNLMDPADEIEIVQTPEGGVQINITASKGEDKESEEGSEETPVATDIDEYNDKPMEGMVDEMIDLEEEPVYEIEISEEDLNEVAKEATAHMTTKGGSVPTGEKKLEEPSKESGMIKNAATKDINESTQNKAGNKNKEKELHESLVVMRKKYQETVAENNKKTQELDSFKTLAEEFKGSETEYKSAIKNLKSQLQEVALFSSNLTYAIKLITENSTTKDEKLNILKRFDSAKNLNESREIFNSLQDQLVSVKSATKQVIEDKIMETPKASGSSKLNESTAYQNPQLSRMLDIIGKIK
jgi:hypothetical protein